VCVVGVMHSAHLSFLSRVRQFTVIANSDFVSLSPVSMRSARPNAEQFTMHWRVSGLSPPTHEPPSRGFSRNFQKGGANLRVCHDIPAGMSPPFWKFLLRNNMTPLSIYEKNRRTYIRFSNFVFCGSISAYSQLSWH